MINRTDEWIVVASEAYQYQQLRKQIELKEKQALEKLRMLSEEKTSHGGGFLFAKEIRVGSVDYKSIPLLRGLDLEPYRKATVEFWKLSKVS